MGMPLAFIAGQANFSGIDGATDLSIEEVVHQAYISVDEVGTTAAAATGVGVGTSVAIISSVPFLVDHPFIFAIVDNTTNTVLFIGQANDPLSN
jgi:serpin B